MCFIVPSRSVRLRRADLDLLGRVEFLHAEHDDFRAFIDAAGNDDVVALVGFHGDRLQGHVALVVDDVERGIAALAVQRRHGSRATLDVAGSASVSVAVMPSETLSPASGSENFAR